MLGRIKGYEHRMAALIDGHCSKIAAFRIMLSRGPTNLRAKSLSPDEPSHVRHYMAFHGPRVANHNDSFHSSSILIDVMNMQLDPQTSPNHIPSSTWWLPTPNPPVIPCRHRGSFMRDPTSPASRTRARRCWSCRRTDTSVWAALGWRLPEDVSLATGHYG